MFQKKCLIRNNSCTIAGLILYQREVGNIYSFNSLYYFQKDGSFDSPRIEFGDFIKY